MVRFIFLGCLLMITTTTFSQKIELEFNIRPAWTSLRGKPIPDRFDPSWYCTNSIGANYVFKNNSLIMLDLLYDRKGTRDKMTGIADAPSSYWKRDEYNFQYLTIPVQFAHRFGKKVQFQLGVGFYSSFLLKFEYLTVDSDGESRKIAGSELVKKTDFGLSTSLAVMLPVRDKFSINLVVDDHYGLTDLNAESAGSDNSIRHNSLGVSLGFGYRIK